SRVAASSSAVSPSPSRPQPKCLSRACVIPHSRYLVPLKHSTADRGGANPLPAATLKWGAARISLTAGKKQKILSMSGANPRKIKTLSANRCLTAGNSNSLPSALAGNWQGNGGKDNIIDSEACF